MKNVRFKVFSLMLFVLICGLVFNKETLWGLTKYKLGLETIHLEKVHQVVLDESKPRESTIGFVVINENIIVIEDRKIILYDKLGHIQWEKEVLSNNIELKGNSQIIVIADKEQGNLFTIDYMGNIVGEKYGLSSFAAIAVSETGVSVLNDKDLKIINLDIELNEIGELELAEGNIVNFTKGNFDNLLSLSYMALEEGAIDNKVFTYNTGGELISGLNFSTELVLGIKIVDDNVLVVSENRLTSYNIKDNTSWEYNFDYELYGYDTSRSGHVLLNFIVPDDGVIEEPETYKLVLVNNKGEAITEIDQKEKVNLTSLKMDKMALSMGKEIVILDYQGNTILKEGVGNDIKAINWLDDKYIMIEFSNFAEVYEMTF